MRPFHFCAGLRGFLFVLPALVYLAPPPPVQGQGQIITTFAGNGGPGYNGDGIAATSAEIDGPAGLAVDSNNNIYILDVENFRVRKVDASTGLISTVAGTGVQGLLGDGGPAVSAQIGYAFGLCLDAAGDIYITDFFNACVREITPGGIISTVAGIGGTTGYSGDGGPANLALMSKVAGVAVDSKNNLYIADAGNAILRKVDGTTGIISTYAGIPSTAGYTGDGGPATQATLSFPENVGVDGQGNVYELDSASEVVRKIDAATGIITTWAGTGVAGFAGDGGPAVSARFNYVGSISFDGAGNAYLTDETPNARVRRVDPSGIINTVAGNGTQAFCGDGGPPLAACLFHPEDTAIDSLGNLYIADYENYRVRKVTGLAVASTPTPSLTPTLTSTYTSTPTLAPSFTPSSTPTATPTGTATATFTPTYTSTPACVPQVWPDPFNPKFAKDGFLKIGCVPPGASVSIYTLSGEAVWGANQSSFQYGSPDTEIWDGTNQNGVLVSPGIYYYAVMDGNRLLLRGKFMVVKGP